MPPQTRTPKYTTTIPSSGHLCHVACHDSRFFPWEVAPRSHVRVGHAIAVLGARPSGRASLAGGGPTSPASPLPAPGNAVLPWERFLSPRSEGTGQTTSQSLTLARAGDLEATVVASLCHLSERSMALSRLQSRALPGRLCGKLSRSDLKSSSCKRGDILFQSLDRPPRMGTGGLPCRTARTGTRPGPAPSRRRSPAPRSSRGPPNVSLFLGLLS